MSRELNARQKAFADNYIKNGGNAMQAALEAGYSENYAKARCADLTENSGIRAYIADHQAKIESTRICTLQEIQEFRSRIVRGEEKDAFGLDIGTSDRMQAAAHLEKALTIQAQEEEKRKAAELARLSKTYHIDLDDIPDTFHPVIRDIRNRGHLEYVFEGGRGSTKSSTVAMIILELLKNNHDIHAVVCRKVGNTIKDSVYSKIKWAIGKQEIEEEWDAKKSPLEITLKATGQKIYFRGADDPDKIKSIAPEFGYIGILWFEELDQFDGEEEIRKIEQSALRGGEIAYLFKTFNPPKTNSNFANKSVTIPKKNRLVHHSTYKDVPPGWLGRPFIEEAEHLKEINPNAYEHEYDGIPNGNGGMVFEFLELRDISDDEIARMDRLYMGVDWGWFPDYYAFIICYYNPKDEKVYIIDEHCCNKTPNKDTAAWILEHYKSLLSACQYGVVCDSAEPKSISDYKDLGVFNATPAFKPPGSVEYGMKWLQGRTIVIDQKRTPYAFKEITNYEYARDKDGEVITGYPDENNHCIDALRYSLSPLFLRRMTQA
jgi:PBSX family phage terminase large subunit